MTVDPAAAKERAEQAYKLAGRKDLAAAQVFQAVTAVRADVVALADRLAAAEAAQNDPDYSPAYQDEYQRLWHRAAAQRDALLASVRRLQREIGHGSREEPVCAICVELNRVLQEVEALGGGGDANRPIGTDDDPLAHPDDDRTLR